MNSKLGKLQRRLKRLELLAGIGEPIFAWLVDPNEPGEYKPGSWLVNGESFEPSVIRERARRSNSKIFLAVYVVGASE